MWGLSRRVSDQIPVFVPELPVACLSIRYLSTRRSKPGGLSTTQLLILSKAIRLENTKQTKQANHMSQNPMDFSFSTGNVDTSFPSLAVADYPVKIEKWEMKDAKDNLKMIKLTVETLEPSTDTNGKLHPPGFKITTNLSLPQGTPESPHEHDEMRLKSIASFQDAVMGLPDGVYPARPPFSSAFLNEAIGKKVKAIVKPRKDTTYGDTEIKGFKHIPTPTSDVGAAPTI
jgi:hypothetical protein